MMEIADLAQEEKLALLGLVRMMIRLDGEFSDEEAERLEAIVQELGEDEFATLSTQVSDLMQDEEQVRFYAARVQRKEAQELLYGLLFDMAVPGSIVKAEADLLEWLQQTWKLEAYGNAYRS